MAFVTLQLPENLEPTTARVLRSILAQLDGILSREHNADGTHGAITARSINLEPNPVLDQEADVLSLYGTDELSIVGLDVGTHLTLYTEGKSTIRIDEIVTGGGAAAIAFFQPTAVTAPVHGEMFLLENCAAESFTLIHSVAPYGVRLPQDTDYLFEPNVSVQFRYDGLDASWRPFMVPFTVGGTLTSGDIFLRLGACPPGSTIVTAFDGQFLMGGLAAAAGDTGGSSTHTHAVAITSAGGGAHTPAGTVAGTNASESAHTHGFSATTDAESAHTHGFSATTDTESGHTHGFGTTTDGESGHTHGFGTTTDGGSAHGHSYTGTTDPGGGAAVVNFDVASGGDISLWAYNTDVGTNDHDHGYGGTTANESAHTHTLSGTSGAGSGHTHTLSGTSAAGSAHDHDVAGTSAAGSAHAHGVAGTSAAGSAHTHTFSGSFSGTAVGDHTHGVSGTTGTQTALPPWKKIVLCQKT